MPNTTDALPPLITVIGATGTGKSNLAVDLAQALSGEIINADAMQMYKGLSIITNKITPAEAKGIPHHLLGFLNVRDSWRVDKFVKEAERTIDDIRARGKLPILVGGTHYYIQSLLFPHSCSTEPSAAEGDGDDESHLFPPIPNEQLEEKYPILTSPTPDLYAHLQSIDPLIAARWHPNDRRKILRSLIIYYASDCKRTASDVYAAQRARRNTGSSGTGVTSWTRYRNLIFWVHATPGALKVRLDKRIDNMIAEGMWGEIEEMKQTYDAVRLHNASVCKSKTRKQEGRGEDDEVDLESGIWQSIGFKEFLPFLQRRDDFVAAGITPALESGIWQSIGFKEFLPFLQRRDCFVAAGITPALESGTVKAEKNKTQINLEDAKMELEKLMETAVADMKKATKQYAKSQTRWIRIKFLNALHPTTASPIKNGDIFLLDSTDATKFTENVSSKGVEITKDFLLNNPLPDPLTLSPLASTSLPPKRDYDFSHRPDLWVQRVCELCKVTCVNDDLWKHHERSKRHKMAVLREKGKPVIEAFIKMRKEAEAKNEGGTGQD